MLTADRTYSSLASLRSASQKRIAVAVAAAFALLIDWGHLARERSIRWFRGARHGLAVVARWCSAGISAVRDGTQRGWAAGITWAHPRVDALVQAFRRGSVRFAYGSRAAAEWLRAMVQGVLAMLVRRSRAMLLRSAPHVRRLGSSARAGWRRYVGVSTDEFVIDVDVDDDVVPTEIFAFPSRLPPPPPLPPLPAPSRYGSDDVAPEESGEFDRISQICSPAVVRLARTSGFEARARFSAPSSERTSEMGHRRRTAS